MLHFNNWPWRDLVPYFHIMMLFCLSTCFAVNGWNDDGASKDTATIMSNCKSNPWKCLTEYSQMDFNRPESRSRLLFYHGDRLCNSGDPNCEKCSKQLQFRSEHLEHHLTDLEFTNFVDCIVDLSYDSYTKKIQTLLNRNMIEDLPKHSSSVNIREKRKEEGSAMPLLTPFQGNERVVKRASIMELCPDTMERIHCFEHYMSEWIQTLMENQRKRTIFAPGKKRNSLQTPRKKGNRYIGSMKMLIDLCPPNANQVDCYNKILSMLISLKSRRQFRNRKSTDEGESKENNLVENDVRITLSDCDSGNDHEDMKWKCYFKNMNAKHNSYIKPVTHSISLGGGYSSKDLDFPIKTNKRIGGLCPESMDKVSCFEHYLKSLASTSKNKERSSNEFIGRKAK